MLRQAQHDKVVILSVTKDGISNLEFINYATSYS